MSGDVPAEVVEALRVKLRHGLASSGQVPPDKLDQVVDLAIHAAVSAINTCQRLTIATAPDFRVGLAAFGPALSILTDLTASHLLALKGFAASQGLPVSEIKLQMGTMQ